MGITMTTTQAELQTYINARIEQWRKAMVYALRYAGEQCLACARQSHTYTDRTGNLTSSIGYVVVVDGKVVNSAFGGGKAGEGEGKTFAETLAATAPQGVVLIVVAGMEYASYVSARGYDVLDSAEMLAARVVPQLLSQLKLDL